MAQSTKYSDVVDYINDCSSERVLKYFQYLINSRLEVLKLQKLVDNYSVDNYSKED